MGVRQTEIVETGRRERRKRDMNAEYQETWKAVTAARYRRRREQKAEYREAEKLANS